MFTKRDLSYSRMNSLIETIGEDGLLSMICSRVSEGEKLKDIARANGIVYAVLWKWLKAEGRMAEYEAALEAKADMEANEALTIADNASVEDVQVARLRIDTRMKLASKWSRNRYGDGNGLGSAAMGGITIVIGEVQGHVGVAERLDIQSQAVIEAENGA